MGFASGLGVLERVRGSKGRMKVGGLKAAKESLL